MKKEELFRFKKFALSHSQSAIKIGVDGVLIGAWGDVCLGLQKPKILDVGCGCGLISMMAAQRCESAEITAIDIDHPSVREASQNFQTSCWANRLKALCIDINEFCNLTVNHHKFDAVISNPPFFSSGISNPLTPREKARHQGLLSPLSLISFASILLKEKGRLSFIAEYKEKEVLIHHCKLHNMSILKICNVRSNPNKAPHRIMITAEYTPEKSYESTPVEIDFLDIRNEKSEYSVKYKDLTGDFYIIF